MNVCVCMFQFSHASCSCCGIRYLQDQINLLVANVEWQMSIDRKIGALKQLQVRTLMHVVDADAHGGVV